MATGQLAGVLRHIRHLVGTHEVGGLSDGQLLERFCAAREEAAFAALVERHAGLVLGVCRRVLGHAQDAEDAFQATFLVLAQKADTIRKRDSVGSWLYGVAYHVAREAKLRAHRRRTHERQAQDMATPESLAEAVWPELKPVLDEELHRLPDKYRVPLVLCYLQGKTNREAARELGWPVGSISRRLARGRELLRHALSRRGVALTGATLTAALTHQAASAAAPLGLLGLTVRAALRLAAGQPVATGSAYALHLARGALKTMTLSKIKSAMLLVFVAGVFGLAAAAHQAPAQKPAEQPVVPPTNENANRPTPKAEAKKAKSIPETTAQADADAEEKITLTGGVFDAAGKPVGGARVAAVAQIKSSYRINLRMTHSRLIGRTRADRAGRFRLRLPRLGRDRFWSTFLLAAHPGHGLGYRQLETGTPREVPVYLTKERVVRGRLFDLQGKPAAGARVGVVWVNGVLPARKSWVYVSLTEPPRDWPFWPESAPSDAHGRFTLRGLGAELRLKLEIRGEPYAGQQFDVGPEHRKQAKELRFSLPPARILEGTVTFADTGKPVANARLLVHARKSIYELNPWIDPIRLRADARGRFRAVPHAGSHFTVLAYPPAGTPYHLLRKELDWPQADLLTQQVNLALPRGILVRGTVTEKPSGKPVAGAGIRFVANRDNNPYYREDVEPFHQDWEVPYVSGPDGKFEVPVLPGRGHLLVNGPTPDYVRTEIRHRKLYGSQINPDWRNYVDGCVALDLKPQKGPHEVKVALRRGVTVRGKVVGPSGKPVPKAVLFSRVYLPFGLNMNPVPTKEVKDGRFELPGCDPDEPVEVFFYDAKDLLGGTVQLSPKDVKDKPVTVRLGRCGTATARLVDKNGKPVPHVRVQLQVVITPGLAFPGPPGRKGPVADHAFMGNLDPDRFNGLRSDLQGRIALPALIPGATYWVIAESPSRGFYDLNKEFKAGAGQTLDLGDIRGTALR
jgi:RNA polymerase sigma factor (sigma-70 family)